MVYPLHKSAANYLVKHACKFELYISCTITMLTMKYVTHVPRLITQTK